MVQNGITAEEMKEITRLFQMDREEKVAQDHAEAEEAKSNM